MRGTRILWVVLLFGWMASGQAHVQTPQCPDGYVCTYDTVGGGATLMLLLDLGYTL